MATLQELADRLNREERFTAESSAIDRLALAVAALALAMIERTS